MSDEEIIVTEFDSDYDGLMVECPFCDPEDPDGPGYHPRPYLKSGRYHECGREFEVRAVWGPE